MVRVQPGEPPLFGPLEFIPRLANDGRVAERADVEAHGLARLLRAVLDKVVVCAWCRRVSVAGEWREAVDEPELLHSLDEDALLSHGICPSCFGRYVAGVAYPR